MSDTLLIENAQIITATDIIDRGWLLARAGKISAWGFHDFLGDLTPDQRIDAIGLTLLPGFIDIHMHGALGHDVMDADADGLRTIAKFCAAHGVTSFLPTTLTASHTQVMAALETIKSVMGTNDGAAIVGAHLEGPYLNREKAGAQNPADIRLADPSEIADIINTGILRLADVAPEFPENLAAISTFVEAGITVSIAHSTADYDQFYQAVKCGLLHSTHTYNAQTGLHHRQPGIVGAVLSHPNITCELIADLVHVHPAAIRVLWAAKKPHHVVLITDSMRAAGMPDGEYTLHDLPAWLQGNSVRLADGTLAGSILTMDKALRNFLQVTGESLQSAWQVSSLNTARAIGVSAHKGSIERGKDADLVLVDEAIQVNTTIVDGKVVYQRDAT